MKKAILGTDTPDINKHPLDSYLRVERLPHIWCPGCGLGTVLGTLITALLKSGQDMEKVVMVSGIGCTGRAAGYVRFDSFHTTHGRAIPFGTGLKLANPELKVVIFSGDGDLAAIGGNHLIHAARRNIDMMVICVNNFTYGMTGGQLGPTTPLMARTTTSRQGNTENPFNIPYLATASGAVYIARWTTAQVRQLEKAMVEATIKKGFRLIEVINPCPTYFGRMNSQATGLDQMRYYRHNTVVRNGAPTKDVGIELNGQIITGKFVDIERPYLPSPQDESA